MMNGISEPILTVGFAAASAIQLSYRTPSQNTLHDVFAVLTSVDCPAIPPQLGASMNAYLVGDELSLIGMLNRGAPPATSRLDVNPKSTVASSFPFRLFPWT